MEWRQQFLTAFPERDYLFIDQDSVFWITHHITATPIKQAQLRKEGLAYHLRNHSFSAMYVFQRYMVDEQTGTLTIDPPDDLGEGFEVEAVWEKRITTLMIGRISRITAIHEGDDVTQARPYALPSNQEARSSSRLQDVKANYLENWIEQLP